MSKEIISTGNAPGAIGPYSQGVVSGDFLFTSGQLPIDPATGKADSTQPDATPIARRRKGASA